MSRREDVDNAIWNDPEFAGLTPPAKLLYLWSFTNPHCNMSGLYKIRREVSCFETGMSTEQVTGALAELEAARMLFYEDGVMFVRARVKHLRTKAPNMAKAVVNDVRKLREQHPMRVSFLAEYATVDPELDWVAPHLIALGQRDSEPLRNPSQTPSEPLPIPKPFGTLPKGSRERAREGQGRRGDTSVAREPSAEEAVWARGVLAAFPALRSLLPGEDQERHVLQAGAALRSAKLDPTPEAVAARLTRQWGRDAA